MNILIIDDDTKFLEMLAWMLGTEGFKVTAVSNGDQGIKIINQQAVDLLITDMLMPDKEGVELIQEIRGGFPDLPIIAMSGGVSGSSTDTMFMMAKRLGAQEVLAKPFSKDEVLMAIRKSVANEQ
ncbi:MAG: response regulator [Magnetococcales bacterium]|nr:response regulator [Magnetococcales bacterium]